MKYRVITFAVLVGAILLISLVMHYHNGRPVRNPVVDVPEQTWEKLTASAVIAMKAGENDEALRICSEAMNMTGQGSPGDTRPAKTYMLMGEIHRWGKRIDLAEESYKQAVTSCEKAVGSNHPDMTIPLDALANFYYFTLNRYDLVAPLYQRILNIVENQPDRNDREAAIRARNLAEVYLLQKQYEQAEPLFRQALFLSEKTNDDLPNYLLSLAECYRLWGKCEMAEPPAKRALMIRERAATPDGGQDAQLDLAVCLDGLARIYLTCGKYDEAQALYNWSFETVEKTAGENSPDLVPRLAGLADALRLGGKLDQAEARYKQALTVLEFNFGADAPEAVEIMEKYAQLLKDMHRPDEAKNLSLRIESILKNSSTE